MLAHKAEEEGVAVAERIAGQKPHVDFNTVPWVIYTSPEIAWVGQTEQQLKADGRDVSSRHLPVHGQRPRARLGDTTGFVKMLADAKTDEILGVHMIGPMVSELIAEAVVAMEFKAASEDIARICHAHPSLSEATKEAALAVDKRALNFLQRGAASAQLYEQNARRTRLPRRPGAAARGRRAGALRERVGRLQGAPLERAHQADHAPADPARRLHVGRRRARQELPDGLLLQRRAAAAQDAPALPRVHARGAPRAGRADRARPIRSTNSASASRGAFG